MEVSINILAAIVVENFNHNVGQQMLVTRLQDMPGNKTGYLYINAALSPIVDFGDTIYFNVNTGESYVYHGNSRLTFKLTTYLIPLNLFYTLFCNQPETSARGC